MDMFLTEARRPSQLLHLQVSAMLWKRIKACRKIVQSFGSCVAQPRSIPSSGLRTTENTGTQTNDGLNVLQIDRERFSGYFQELISGGFCTHILENDCDPERYSEFTVFCCSSGRFVVAVDRSSVVRRLVVLAVNCPQS